VLRSGTQLEGPKSISDEVGSQERQDKGAAPMPSKSEAKEKRENKKQKESKTFPLSLTCLPFP